MKVARVLYVVAQTFWNWRRRHTISLIDSGRVCAVRIIVDLSSKQAVPCVAFLVMIEAARTELAQRRATSGLVGRHVLHFSTDGGPAISGLLTA